MTKYKGIILVTGGAGYIGVVLVEQLVALGFRVRVLDNLYFGIKPLNKFLDKIQLVKGDVLFPPSGIFSDVSAIIHLAALSNDPMADFDPEANSLINTKATVNLAIAAKKNKIERFIFASSCSIYDNSKMSGVKSENSMVSPVKFYSLSKYQAENQILELADRSFCVVVLRKGTVYGFSPRMRFDLVVNSMVKSAIAKNLIYIMGTGIQWRPLIDVRDVAEAYIKALGIPLKKINKQIINISQNNFMVKNIAHIVKENLEKRFNLKIKLITVNKTERDRSYKVSTEKAQKLMAFSPKYSINESVVSMVEQIRANKITDFNNPLFENIAWMRKFLNKNI